MRNTEIATLQFVDAEAHAEAIVIIRVVQPHIAVCLSRQDNGDIEVVLNRQDCQAFVDALQQALTISND